MLTIFSLPKAFAGHDGVIQDNAIASWARLGGGCEIFLLGDDPGTAEAAKRHGVGYLGPVGRTAHGTPIVKDVFDKAEASASHALMCYVNADIILMDDFLVAVERVSQRFPDFLLVSRRWNLDIREPLAFGPDWQSELRARAAREATLHLLHGTDFFVYRAGMFADMPPFAIGRTVWDNWLMYAARRRGGALVDATQDVAAIHQNHDYGHIPAGKAGAWKGPEARENFRLAGGYPGIYTVYDATFLLKGGELISTYWPRYLYRHMRARLGRTVMAWLTDHPRAHALWQGLRGRLRLYEAA